MGNDKAKTKSAMLSELESIKGLLLEDDDIPILQEVIEQQPPKTEAVAARLISEQQQDFFQALEDHDSGEELLESLDDLEEKATQLAVQKADTLKPSAPMRPSITKASGENPFLPEHIRARLHGNNPPPLFASETAKKIADTSRPVTQLGNLQTRGFGSKLGSAQQDLIDSIVARMMPEMERELRQRLESMSKSMLGELNKF